MGTTVSDTRLVNSINLISVQQFISRSFRGVFTLKFQLVTGKKTEPSNLVPRTCLYLEVVLVSNFPYKIPEETVSQSKGIFQREDKRV